MIDPQNYHPVEWRLPVCDRKMMGYMPREKRHDSDSEGTTLVRGVRIIWERMRKNVGKKGPWRWEEPEPKDQWCKVKPINDWIDAKSRSRTDMKSRSESRNCEEGGTRLVRGPVQMAWDNYGKTGSMNGSVRTTTTYWWTYLEIWRDGPSEEPVLEDWRREVKSISNPESSA